MYLFFSLIPDFKNSFLSLQEDFVLSILCYVLCTELACCGAKKALLLLDHVSLSMGKGLWWQEIERDRPWEIKGSFPFFSFFSVRSLLVCLWQMLY